MLASFLICFWIAVQVRVSYLVAIRKRKEILALEVCGISFSRLVTLADGVIIFFSVYNILFVRLNSGAGSALILSSLVYLFNIVAIIWRAKSQTIFSLMACAVARFGNIAVSVMIVSLSFVYIFDKIEGRYNIEYNNFIDIKGFVTLCAFGFTTFLNVFLLSKNVEMAGDKINPEEIQ